MPAPTRSLTPAHVHDHVRRHCFTADDPPGRVGVELELLTFVGHDGRRPTTVELHSVLDGLSLPGNARLSLEPGGQVELSSLPHLGPAAAIDATAADLDMLLAALRTAGIRTMAVGLDPVRPNRRVVRSPRYDAMEDYFEDDGGAGLAMMGGTASVQVNLDLGDAASLSPAVGVRLTPSAPSWCRPSPTRRWPVGVPRERARPASRFWAVLDRTRSAPAVSSLPPVESWARYALAAQVVLVRESPDRYEAVRHDLTFARWMAEGHELGYPTLDDFDYHLTTLFPPVRPKGWLELRMIDAVPDPWWQVAVAVTTALLDDAEAFDMAERTCAPVAECWAEAAAHGPAHPGLASAARTCFAAAIAALPRLGADRAIVAAVEAFTERYVERGRCPGDDLLEAWTDGADQMAVTASRAP